MVIETGRPVLYMGGFGGQDQVVDAGDLAQMVAEGELKFVLYGGDRGNKQDIANWLNSSCEVVPEFRIVESGNPGPPDGGVPEDQDQFDGPGRGSPEGSFTLYQCGG